MKLTVDDLGASTLAVWQAIADYHLRHGYAPTFRELAIACGLSSASVAKYHVRRLEAAGIVRRTTRVARGMVLLRYPRRQEVVQA